MPPNPTMPSVPIFLRQGRLGASLIFTMLMTNPQVLTIWGSHRATGVPLVSWSAYLFSAVVWL